MKSTLNTTSVIAHFGGATMISRLLRKSSEVRVSVRTIESWVARNSIPLKRLMELVELGEAIAKPLVLDQHIQKNK